MKRRWRHCLPRMRTPFGNSPKRSGADRRTGEGANPHGRSSRPEQTPGSGQAAIHRFRSSPQTACLQGAKHRYFRARERSRKGGNICGKFSLGRAAHCGLIRDQANGTGRNGRPAYDRHGGGCKGRQGRKTRRGCRTPTDIKYRRRIPLRRIRIPYRNPVPIPHPIPNLRRYLQ